jgi:uncharacterized protein (TIGR03382 family)
VETFPLPPYVDYSYRPEFTQKHRGVDIFADQGAPVVAVVSGLARIANDPRGGQVVYLQGADGNTYYYAHLESWTPELMASAEGTTPVTAGTVLGTVGTTGNAQGTTPHLHFQVHASSGDIDPFPALQAIDPHLEEAPNLGVHPLPEPPPDIATPASKPGKASEGVGVLLALIGFAWLMRRRKKDRRR